MFGKQLAEQKKEVVAIIKQAYEEQYAAEIAAAELMPKALRKNMLDVRSIKVRLPHKGSNLRLRNQMYKEPSKYSRSTATYTEDFSLVTPFLFGELKDNRGWSHFDLPITKETAPITFPIFEAFHTQVEDLEASIQAASSQISAVLASVNTDKQLKDLAPELMQFMPAPPPCPTGTALLPMDTVKSVRALLQGVTKE